MPDKKEDANKSILLLILILSCFVGFVLIGVFAGKAALMTVTGPCVVFCAFMDYDWFMNSYKTAPFRALFGREGTQVIYILFGIILFIMGLFSF